MQAQVPASHCPLLCWQEPAVALGVQPVVLPSWWLAGVARVPVPACQLQVLALERRGEASLLRWQESQEESATRVRAEMGALVRLPHYLLPDLS